MGKHGTPIVRNHPIAQHLRDQNLSENFNFAASTCTHWCLSLKHLFFRPVYNSSFSPPIGVYTRYFSTLGAKMDFFSVRCIIPLFHPPIGVYIHDTF